jgi:hypothetical protein
MEKARLESTEQTGPALASSPPLDASDETGREWASSRGPAMRTLAIGLALCAGAIIATYVVLSWLPLK